MIARSRLMYFIFSLDPFGSGRFFSLNPFGSGFNRGLLGSGSRFNLTRSFGNFFSFFRFFLARPEIRTPFL